VDILTVVAADLPSMTSTHVVVRVARLFCSYNME